MPGQHILGRAPACARRPAGVTQSLYPQQEAENWPAGPYAASVTVAVSSRVRSAVDTTSNRFMDVNASAML
jgi:hypothetical protein